MLNEYEEILARFYNENIADIMVSFIINSPHTEEITPHYQWHLIYYDQDDNKFVDCALNAGADYIVTNDKHFNILKDIDFPKINIIDIENFSRIFF
jgi:predicted nucleic acid-binding protein